MNNAVSFRGVSGEAHGFKQVDVDSAWAGTGGVALFAAPDAFGWRIIRIVEISGRIHDARPIWAFADAQRYGATTGFVCAERDAYTRSHIMADLDAGLTPVCTVDTGLAIAA